MPLPRSIKPAVLAALWVACTVALVAWAYHPAHMLEVDGPGPDAVVTRDGTIAWRLNLPLEAEHLGEAPLPSIDPAVPGSFAWRDARTCVFTPSGALPADARFTVRFDPELRAKGGFRFDDEAVPVSTLRTLPELRALAAMPTAIPAFADGGIEVELNRVPDQPETLLRAVSVDPAVPIRVTLVDGRLRVDGPFAPRTAYRLSIAASGGAADDRPAAFSAEVTMPARTPGVRIAAGVGRQPRLEAVGVDVAVVEAMDGRRDVVRFVPVDDAVVTADLPVWLLHAGDNRLRLRWQDGEAEAALHRHDLRLTPEDAVPALLGGAMPVTAALTGR